MFLTFVCNPLDGLCSDATYFLINEALHLLLESETQGGGWGGSQVCNVETLESHLWSVVKFRQQNYFG